MNQVGGGLPTVTTEDDGKSLIVKDGQWQLLNAIPTIDVAEEYPEMQTLFVSLLGQFIQYGVAHPDEDIILQSVTDSSTTITDFIDDVYPLIDALGSVKLKFQTGNLQGDVLVTTSSHHNAIAFSITGYYAEAIYDARVILTGTTIQAIGSVRSLN